MIPSGVASRSDEAAGLILPWVLRVGVAGCFIGHGAFGIITKAAWVPYFAVAGVPEPLAWKLMPWIGTMDILMGILALAWPCRALFLWAGLWAVWTALLRPLSGEPFWEALERAGNYGVPFAILAVTGTSGSLFGRLRMRWADLDARREQLLAWVLQLTTATLLAGHAGLGLLSRKAGLAHHYEALGLASPAAWVPAIGAFEFFLAAAALLMRRPALLIFACCWKLATESLFLVAGAPIFEVIERAGSYTAPLALAYLVFVRRTNPRSSPAPSAAPAAV